MVAVMSQATKKNYFWHIEVTKEEGHRCDMIFKSDRDCGWNDSVWLFSEWTLVQWIFIQLFCSVPQQVCIYLVDYAVDY